MGMDLIEEENMATVLQYQSDKVGLEVFMTISPLFLPIYLM